MIVDCAHYRDGQRQHQGPIELADAASICMHDDGFVWLGLFEPDAAELADVQARFGLHELAVEDALSEHMRPKLERYDEGDVLFAVLRTARYEDETEEVEFGELSVFVSKQFVVTVRRGDPAQLGDARARLERRPDLLKEGTRAVLWAILDTVVDGYKPVTEGLERDVEEAEATVFGGAAAPTERIYLLRREATEFYRVVHPLLGPLDALERGGYMKISKGLRQYFRDVNDHLKLINDDVVSLRDTLGIILQANMAVISNEQNELSNRQNETMKVLTVVATVFLPLTFITGFFGMNFDWLIGHTRSFWVFCVFGVGSLIISCAILWTWFRRSGHIGSEDSAGVSPGATHPSGRPISPAA